MSTAKLKDPEKINNIVADSDSLDLSQKNTTSAEISDNSDSHKSSLEKTLAEGLIDISKEENNPSSKMTIDENVVNKKTIDDECNIHASIVNKNTIDSESDIVEHTVNENTTENDIIENINFESSLKYVDIINYCGAISREGYFLITNLIEYKIKNGEKSNNVLLILTTTGGDPDYGYRIGRALNHHYNHVTIMISDICKSAGTLVAISAHKLIIGDLGELGPLDIQLSKADEMGEQASSLDIFKTINELQKATLDSFRHFVTDIRFGSRVSTKLSAEIASNLTKTLISPISAQIDPIKLGEQKRALQIAKEYATRLNDLSNNLRPGALERLINDYPCHSFVIDRKEAKELFYNVKNTSDEDEEVLYKFTRLYLSKINFEQICISSFPQVVTFEAIINDLHQQE
ncbi:SDH family Clp fold serine proteinase [Photobacterium damselae]|uniref:SDH family Clp fold serine proteinase n=1 Tax=Photobacterium damselae TaxID=38293 RepID=UPI003B674DC1